VKLSKLVPVFALSVALTGTLAAAQATKAPAGSSTTQKGADKSSSQSTSTKKGAAPKMTAADLPQPVRDAVMKAHPSGTISSVSTSGMGADMVYNVRVTDAGKNTTMHLKADGTSSMAAKGATKSGSTTGETKSKTGETKKK
jgi:hypothetical protein